MLRPTCRLCKHCGKVEKFTVRSVNGRRYLRTSCCQCESKKRMRLGVVDTLAYRQREIKYNKRKQWERKYNIRVAKWIRADARGWDRKHGFVPCALTEQQIEQLIVSGCSYCGETTLRMTLDRIDNKQGHTLQNVRAACIRCNYLRRDMPYHAWMALVPMVRKIVAQGLFGTWANRCR